MNEKTKINNDLNDIFEQGKSKNNNYNNQNKCKNNISDNTFAGTA